MLTYSKLDTVTAIYKRRAVRSYTPEKLERATIKHLLDAAVQAPTALHAEPWAFVVIQDKVRLRRYSDRAKTLLLDQQQAISHLQSAEPQALAMLSNPDFNIFYDAGALIVVCCKAKGPFVEADCWLAAENLDACGHRGGAGNLLHRVCSRHSEHARRQGGVGNSGRRRSRCADHRRIPERNCVQRISQAAGCPQMGAVAARVMN
ncbi:nitroreductase family protein [Bradyrhizobium sp. 13971]